MDKNNRKMGIVVDKSNRKMGIGVIVIDHMREVSATLIAPKPYIIASVVTEALVA